MRLPLLLKATVVRLVGQTHAGELLGRVLTPAAARFALLALFLIIPTSVMAQSVSAHFKRGVDWMDLKQYDRAREEFKRAIDLEPKNSEARYQIARSYYLEGNLNEAVVWCRETLAVAPSYSATAEIIGKISQRMHSQVASTAPSDNREGLRLLGVLAQNRFVDAVPVLRNDVLPLLARSDDRQVLSEAISLLRPYQLELEGLRELASAKSEFKRLVAVELIESSSQPSALVTARLLLTDEVDLIRERVARMLVHRSGDDEARVVLVRVLTRRLRSIIEKTIHSPRFDGFAARGDEQVVYELSNLKPDETAIDAIVDLLALGNGTESAVAGRALLMIGRPALPVLQRALNDRYHDRRGVGDVPASVSRGRINGKIRQIEAGTRPGL